MPQLYIRKLTRTERDGLSKLGYAVTHVLSFVPTSSSREVENTSNETALEQLRRHESKAKTPWQLYSHPEWYVYLDENNLELYLDDNTITDKDVDN